SVPVSVWPDACCVRWPLAPVVFFFFQAEDGIRDFHVTGVQTCALPICRVSLSGHCTMISVPCRVTVPPPSSDRSSNSSSGSGSRSEERRVGKGGRWGGGRGREKRTGCRG